VLVGIYASVVNTKPIDRTTRDVEICRRHQAGESTAALAAKFGLSVQRVRKIIKR
jgi:Mor family transcriptional regulator